MATKKVFLCKKNDGKCKNECAPYGNTQYHCPSHGVLDNNEVTEKMPATKKTAKESGSKEVKAPKIKKTK